MNALSKRITGIVLLLLATGYLWMASQIQISRFVKMTQVIDSRLFPILLGIALAILALLLIFKPDQEDGAFSPRSWFSVLTILASIIIYAYLIVPLGYMLATAILLIAQFVLLGAKPLWAIIVAVAVSVGLYLVFVYGLHVPLPLGKIWS